MGDAVITAVQQKLLRFIANYMSEHRGVSPTYSEMGEGIGLRAKSGIHRIVRWLEERGAIRRLPNRARAIEITRADLLHEMPSVHVERAVVAFPPTAPGNDHIIHTVAIMGTTTKIDTKPVGSLNVPQHFIDGLVGAGGYFALEVRGDAMIGAGLWETDMAIFVATDAAHSGDIAVAIIDGMETLFRRVRRRSTIIAFEAADLHYETRLIGADRVEIKGRMIGMIRRYPDKE